VGTRFSVLVRTPAVFYGARTRTFMPQINMIPHDTHLHFTDIGPTSPVPDLSLWMLTRNKQVSLLSMFDLTQQGIVPQTLRSRSERSTTRPPMRLTLINATQW